MTVAELFEELRRYPQHAPVAIADGDGVTWRVDRSSWEGNHAAIVCNDTMSGDGDDVW